MKYIYKVKTRFKYLIEPKEEYYTQLKFAKKAIRDKIKTLENDGFMLVKSKVNKKGEFAALSVESDIYIELTRHEVLK